MAHEAVDRRPPLIQYWHAEEPPAEIRELFAMARRHNPDMRHLIFNERTAAELIEAQVGTCEAAAFRSCAVPAMQADFFRYCAVYALGGIYCDADSRCTGSLTRLLRADGTLFHLDEAPGDRLANSLFAFKLAGHPLLRLTIDIATANVESRFSDAIPIVVGQWIFISLWRMLRLNSVDAYFDEVLELLEREPNSYVFRSGVERWRRHIAVLRDVVGDRSRVANAFAGIEVRPFSDIDDIVKRSDRNLAYRQTPDHYPNWRGSPYR